MTRDDVAPEIQARFGLSLRGGFSRWNGPLRGKVGSRSFEAAPVEQGIGIEPSAHGL